MSETKENNLEQNNKDESCNLFELNVIEQLSNLNIETENNLDEKFKIVKEKYSSQDKKKFVDFKYKSFEDKQRTEQKILGEMKDGQVIKKKCPENKNEEYWIKEDGCITIINKYTNIDVNRVYKRNIKTTETIKGEYIIEKNKLSKLKSFIHKIKKHKDTKSGDLLKSFSRLSINEGNNNIVYIKNQDLSSPKIKTTHNVTIEQDKKLKNFKIEQEEY